MERRRRAGAKGLIADDRQMPREALQLRESGNEDVVALARDD